jgi:NAD(P)H-hydrate epimerase
VQKIITAAEMREVDALTTERYGLPSLLLMENAALAAAREIETRVPDGLAGKSVLILCGPGNNGGDGAALARHLCLRGAAVEAVLLGRVGQTKGDAAVNFAALQRLAAADAPVFAAGEGSLRLVECPSMIEWEQFAYADLPARAIDVVVDALFGTGLSRPLEGLPGEVVQYLNRARDFREEIGSRAPLFVSLDVPSGLDADAAEPIGPAVRADVTVTFTAPKPANVLAPANECNGQLVAANIGSPAVLITSTPSQLFLSEALDAQTWLRQTRRRPGSYKGAHGHALVVAGSRRYAGAAALCAQAAMRAGAGLVTLATPASANVQTGPEIMKLGLLETKDGAFCLEALEQVTQAANKAHIIALGPGLTAHEKSTRHFARALVEGRALPLVIDADGLNALAPWTPNLSGTSELPIILTPHRAEFLRLLGTDDARVLHNRVEAVRRFAQQFGLVVVLKGARSLIAGPDGRVFVNPTGNPGLGTAGAGDTLTGIIAGFHAQAAAGLGDAYDPLMTTVAAVYVAGRAADLAAQQRGMRALMASDVADCLSAAIRALDPEGETP